jgi:hypothetical protein
MNHCGPKESILNVITQMLCYNDGVVTDNPHMRDFDWRLRLENIPCRNPFSSELRLGPGQTASIFSTVIDSGLVTTTSVLDLDFQSPSESVYRLTVGSGPSAFRTPRAVPFTGVPEAGTISCLSDVSSSVVDSTNLVLGAPSSAPTDVSTGFPIAIVQPGTNLTPESGTISCVADVSYSLNNKFFLISSPATKYYVWFNVGGSGTDPSIPTLTGIMVAISPNATASVVAAQTAAALSALSSVFSASSLGIVVNYTGVIPGPTLVPLNPGDTQFVTAVTTPGTDASAQALTIECSADVSSSLNNTYFLISSTTTNYYVWFNVGGAGTDPAIGGRTGIQVAIAVNSSATVVATALAAALTAVAGVFTATSSPLNSTYFLISSTTVNYYVWLNVAGAGIDPALAGKTGIAVAVPIDASEATVATAVAAAMAALTSVFAASAAGPTVSYTDVVAGPTLSPLAPGNSGFTVNTTTVGQPPGASAAVTINNNSVAMFTFPGANLTALQVGDIMRINGQVGYDTAPYAFNPLNSGNWLIIGISGQTVSATRETGVAFQGAVENPASSVSNDVIFFANDMIMPGMMFQVTGTFSPVTQRTYQVLESTPYFIQFVSTQPIPTQDSVPYAANTITFYDGVKKMVYIEVDQECSVQYNGQMDSLNRITPIKPGDRYLKGFSNKWGDTYSCNVTNQSVSSCRVKFITVE